MNNTARYKSNAISGTCTVEGKPVDGSLDEKLIGKFHLYQDGHTWRWQCTAPKH